MIISLLCRNLKPLPKIITILANFKKQAKKIMPECKSLAEFRQRIQEAPASAASHSSQPSLFKRLLSHIHGPKH